MDKFTKDIRGMLENELSFSRKSELKTKLYDHSVFRNSVEKVSLSIFSKYFLKQKLNFLNYLLSNNSYRYMLKKASAFGVFALFVLPMFSFFWVAPNTALADFDVTVSQISGAIKLQRGSEVKYLNFNDKLLEGDRLFVDDDAYIELSMPSIGLVRLSPGSEMLVSSVGDFYNDSNVNLQLNYGSLWVNTHDVNSSHLQLNIKSSNFNVPVVKNSLLNIDNTKDFRVAVMKNKAEVYKYKSPVDTVFAGQILKSDRNSPGFESFDSSNKWIAENLNLDKTLNPNRLVSSVDQDYFDSLIDISKKSRSVEIDELTKEIETLRVNRERVSTFVAKVDTESIKNELSLSSVKLVEISEKVNSIKESTTVQQEDVQALQKIIDLEIDKQKSLVAILELNSQDVFESKVNLSKAKVAANNNSIEKAKQFQELLLELDDKDLSKSQVADIKEVILDNIDAGVEADIDELANITSENLVLLNDLVKNQSDIEVIEELEDVKSSVKDDIDDLATSYKFDSNLISNGVTKTTDGELLVKEEFDVNNVDQSLNDKQDVMPSQELVEEPEVVNESVKVVDELTEDNSLPDLSNETDEGPVEKYDDVVVDDVYDNGLFEFEQEIDFVDKDEIKKTEPIDSVDPGNGLFEFEQEI